MPPLSPDLAQPCVKLPDPLADDFDAWLTWATQVAMPLYATCAARHDKTVEAWPNAPRAKP